MVNATEFSRKYAETYNVSKKYAAMICESIFSMLGEVLYEDGEDVVIAGFGSFRHKKTAPKRVRHPGTGEMMTIPERDVIKFNPSEAYGRQNKE